MTFHEADFISTSELVWIDIQAT